MLEIRKCVRKCSSNVVYSSRIQNRMFSAADHEKSGVQSFGNFSQASLQP